MFDDLSWQQHCGLLSQDSLRFQNFAQPLSRLDNVTVPVMAWDAIFTKDHLARWTRVSTYTRSAGAAGTMTATRVSFRLGIRFEIHLFVASDSNPLSRKTHPLENLKISPVSG